MSIPGKKKKKLADLSRPEEEWYLEVPFSAAGERLDKFLAGRLPWRSRNRLKREMNEGVIFLDGDNPKPSCRLKGGELVTIMLDNSAISDQDPAQVELDVVYEDDRLLVLNKQPGVVVHPVGRYRYNTIINALHLRYRSDDPALDVVPRLCHRLDRETSGLLLVAKDEDARRLLQYQFERIRSRELPPEAMEMEKEYVALTRGAPDPPEGVIDRPIGPDEDGPVKIRQTVRPDGQPARTKYEVLKSAGGVAMVKLELFTGRTHQIRVHLASIGRPVLADYFYGGTDEEIESDGKYIGRCALHSRRLRVFHPGTLEMTEFTAPVPPDMEKALETAGSADKRSS